jgi:VIT1/CCC1 family predicted Fe2+/Mn2+ transporter
VSTMVAELYDALRKAGVDESTARAAAEAVLGRQEDVATKADIAVLGSELRREMAELKADLIKWNVGAMAVLTAIFAAIVRLA